tara:strand:+ start:1395 stop:1568 length:174 start_codon:yes stop_codon:yes gene_type:complete
MYSIERMRKWRIQLTGGKKARNFFGVESRDIFQEREMKVDIGYRTRTHVIVNDEMIK